MRRRACWASLGFASLRAPAAAGACGPTPLGSGAIRAASAVRRRSGSRRRARRRLAGLLLVALVMGMTAGCATWRGARLYDSGSDALARGETARAIAELEEAAALVPHASEVRNHLGIAYAGAGRHEEALRAFERAVALDCGNEAAQRNLRAARAWRLRAEAAR